MGIARNRFFRSRAAEVDDELNAYRRPAGQDFEAGQAKKAEVAQQEFC